MIIIRMSGGLGNQMFQYALYLQLLRLGREVSFDDVSEYRVHREGVDVAGNARPIALPVFGISYPVCTREALIRMTDADMTFLSRVRRKVFGRRSREKHDEDFVYDPSFLELEEGYFTGCFQSPLYFQGVEEEVRKTFMFPDSPGDDILTEGRATGCAQIPPLTYEEAARNRYFREAILRGSRSGHTCAIHLRFGDYLDKSEVYGGIATEAYYQAAIAYLQARIPLLTFFVFSNDTQRAAEFVGRQTFPERFVIVSGNDEAHGYCDLYLMSLCENFIICNSSFSFWGAWLGQHKISAPNHLYERGTGAGGEKTERRYGARTNTDYWQAGGRGFVIAPSYWINEADGSQLQRTDIFPPDWIRINPAGVCLQDIIGKRSNSGQAYGRVNATKIIAIHATNTSLANATDTRPSNAADRNTANAKDTNPGNITGVSAAASIMAPVISVIVAAYNIENYIAKALYSLARQTYRNMEFIVVDDGSTDHTGQICDAIAAMDARFRVIHKKNGGLSDARNAGLSIARGQWIGFLDGDDTAKPEMYEALLTAAVMANADMAICSYEEVTDLPTHPAAASLEELMTPFHGRQKGSQESSMEHGYLDPPVSVRQIIRASTVLTREQALSVYVRSGVDDEGSPQDPPAERGLHFYNSVWSKLYSRRIVGSLSFPVGRNSEDILYTTKALTGSDKIVFLPAPLYLYTTNRADSIMNQAIGERRLRDEIPFYEEQLQWFSSCGLDKIREKAAFYFARRLLFYWDDSDLASYTDAAAQIQGILLSHKEELLPIIARAEYARRGDRERLKLFLNSPGQYRRLRNLYAKLRKRQ